MKWQTEQRKVKDLIPHDSNPRQMTAKQNEDLTKSLKKFDLAEIPAINTTGKILAGHQRLRIMKALGRGNEIIDVRVPDRELTGEEEREYLIRSNKNLGEFDWDTLANEFDIGELEDWGFEEDEFDGGGGFIKGEGSPVDAEQATQLLPTREYIVVMCDADSWQFDKLIELLDLKNKRRGGYKKGSAFDNIATERVIPASKVIQLLEGDEQ